MVIMLCLIGSLLGCIHCLLSYDIKLLIAYSSISHMNLVVAALFTLNIHSLEGAIITAVAHGLSSSGLFILTGLIHDRIHARNLLSLKGLFNFYPVFSTMFFFFILANMSFPFTLNFRGELLNYIALVKYEPVLIFVVIVLLQLLSVYYNILLYVSLNLRNINVNKFSDLSRCEFLILFMILFILYLSMLIWNNIVFPIWLLCSITLSNILFFHLF